MILVGDISNTQTCMYNFPWIILALSVFLSPTHGLGWPPTLNVGKRLHASIYGLTLCVSLVTQPVVCRIKNLNFRGCEPI